MTTLFDSVKALEQSIFFESIFDEYRLRYNTLSPATLKEVAYSSFCGDLSWHALALQALGRSNEEIQKHIDESINCYLPYIDASLRERRVRFKGGPYDTAAIEDCFFSFPLSLFVSTHTYQEVQDVCVRTNYGRYLGKDNVNSLQGIYCRMIRAFYLKDENWLNDEIEAFRVCRREPDPIHPSFAAAPIRWHELFSALFRGHEQEFNKAVRQHAKWYQQKVKKSASTEKGLKYYASINTVLLSAIKIARSYQGINVYIDDPFVPMDLVVWK